VFIDLLFASSGIEEELAAAAVRVDGVPVGTIGHLLALKVLSESERRLQDRIDIRHLAAVASEGDWRANDAFAFAGSASNERPARRGIWTPCSWTRPAMVRDVATSRSSSHARVQSFAKCPSVLHPARLPWKHALREVHERLRRLGVLALLRRDLRRARIAGVCLVAAAHYLAAVIPGRRPTRDERCGRRERDPEKRNWRFTCGSGY